MNFTRQPSGSSYAKRRPHLGKSSASRLRSRSLTHKGSWTPISRGNTSTITMAAVHCSRRPPMVKAAYQEVVEQMVKVFEDHLKGPRAHERALALVALCVGGMVLARNVCDSDLAENFRRSAYSEVLRTAGWK